jgi:anti-sigma factor RsiW
MNSPDRYRDTHPDTDALDRLRAGLLDDAPAQRQALLDHLGGCDGCRTRYGLADRVRAALDGQLESPAVAGALRARRSAALGGAGSRPRSPTPRLALAGAALSLLVGVGIFLALEAERPTDTLPPLASQEAVPDLYDDLDFYLWLAREREKAANEGNHS